MVQRFADPEYEWPAVAFDQRDDDKALSSKLVDMERIVAARSRRLRRSNLENSQKFQKERAQRLTVDGYSYAVRFDTLWDPSHSKDDDEDIPEEVKRRFPKGIHTYFITTPEGLELALIKEKSTFKILFFWLYPWD